MIQELLSKPILILGCGNVLLGDDGFGPAVIEHLERHYRLPESAFAMDMGTSVRNLLFDLLLLPTRPHCIFIVDAVYQAGRKAGEIFELDILQLPACKTSDFSMHLFPSVNLLNELRNDAGVKVRVLAGQAKEIPARIRPGISEELKASVPCACQWLMEKIGGVS